MGDMLKSAGHARSASIKLSNVPYGKDLSTELLTYAEATEGLFKELQSAMDSGDQKTLQSLLQKWEEKEREGEKAKAGIFLSNMVSVSVKHLRSKTFLSDSYPKHPSTNFFSSCSATSQIDLVLCRLLLMPFWKNLPKKKPKKPKKKMSHGRGWRAINQRMVLTRHSDAESFPMDATLICVMSWQFDLGF